MNIRLRNSIFFFIGTLVLFYAVPFLGNLMPTAFHPGAGHLLVLNPVLVFFGTLFFANATPFHPGLMAAAGLVPGILFMPSAYLFYNSSAVLYGFYNILIGLFAVLVAYLLEERRVRKASGIVPRSVFDREEDDEEDEEEDSDEPDSSSESNTETDQQKFER